MLSGPGLVLYMLTLTFMSVDWVLSLAPHFYSTIFGILMLGGQGLSTLAFTILTLAALARFKPMSDVVEPDHFHDLGKLMLAFVMLWAYFNVSQLIIIYSGNLPEEIPWYLERMQGTWAPVGLGGVHRPLRAAVRPAPLPRPETPARVCSRSVAMFVLFMRVVDLIWTIGPVFRHETSTIHWLDFAAVIGMGGVWLRVLLHDAGQPRACAGARSALQGSDGSWRTLNTTTRGSAPSKATGSAIAASSGSSRFWSITTLVSQLLMVGTFKWLDHDFKSRRCAAGAAGRADRPASAGAEPAVPLLRIAAGQ